MPAFNYIGRDANGSQVKGAIEAVNSAMVAEQLSRKRIIPISIAVSYTHLTLPTTPYV